MKVLFVQEQYPQVAQIPGEGALQKPKLPWFPPRQPCPLYSPDHTAGNLLPGIAGGLGVKIIRCSMEDHCPADDFLHPESGSQHLHVAPPGVSQQRWQIPRMARMLPIAGIEVTAGIGKPIPGAASPFMNVEGEKTGLRPWQPPHLRFHKDTVTALKKLNSSPDGGEICATTDPGYSFWTFRLLNVITPAQPMRRQGF